jgi:hypothetical protein
VYKRNYFHRLGRVELIADRQYRKGRREAGMEHYFGVVGHSDNSTWIADDKVICGANEKGNGMGFVGVWTWIL